MLKDFTKKFTDLIDIKSEKLKNLKRLFVHG